jgi:hypothetical protein
MLMLTMMTRKRNRTKKIKIAAQRLTRRAQVMTKTMHRVIETKRSKSKRNRNTNRNQKKTATMTYSMKTISLRLSQKQ